MIQINEAIQRGIHSNDKLHALKQMKESIFYDTVQEIRDKLVFQGDPIQLSLSLVHQKYMDTFFSPYDKSIDAILKNFKHPVALLYRDYLYYDDKSEYLKRYYKTEESDKRIQNICRSRLEWDSGFQKPSLILHAQNRIIAARYTDVCLKDCIKPLIKASQMESNESISGFGPPQEVSDIGPMHSFNGDKEFFDNDENIEEEETPQAKLSEHVDDGLVHNSFQKMLENYEQMVDMSFESNQYNIYNPDNSSNDDFTAKSQNKSSPTTQRRIDGIMKEDLEVQWDKGFQLDTERSKSSPSEREILECFNINEREIKKNSLGLKSNFLKEHLPSRASKKESIKQVHQPKLTKKDSPLLASNKSPSFLNKKNDLLKKFANQTGPTTKARFATHSNDTKKPSVPDLESISTQLKQIQEIISEKNLSPSYAAYFLSLTKSPGTENIHLGNTLPSKNRTGASNRGVPSPDDTLEGGQKSKKKLGQKFHTTSSSQTSPVLKPKKVFSKEEISKIEHPQNGILKESTKGNSAAANSKIKFFEKGRPKSSSTKNVKGSSSNLRIHEQQQQHQQQSKVLEARQKMKEIFNPDEFHHAKKLEKRNIKSTHPSTSGTQEDDFWGLNSSVNGKKEEVTMNSPQYVPDVMNKCKEALFKSLKKKYQSNTHQSLTLHADMLHNSNTQIQPTVNHAAHASMNVQRSQVNNSGLKDSVFALLNQTSKKGTSRTSHFANIEPRSPLLNNYCRSPQLGSPQITKKTSNSAKKKDKSLTKKPSLTRKNASSSKKGFEFKLDLATLNKIIASSHPEKTKKTDGGFWSSKVTTVDTVADTRTSSKRKSKGLSANRKKPEKFKTQGCVGSFSKV